MLGQIVFSAPLTLNRSVKCERVAVPALDTDWWPHSNQTPYDEEKLRTCGAGSRSVSRQNQ